MVLLLIRLARMDFEKALSLTVTEADWWLEEAERIEQEYNPFQ